jgi:EAL domain-containing protein (putative c-di-GMP-specific phosphodiesterase class I)
VVRAAIQQIVAAASTGTTLRLFVTQASKTVAHPGQVEWLRQQLAERGVPGSQLVIEVRLEDALVHSASVGQFFEALVPEGVQCCLGQFEAGVDADPLIERLPLSYVKLAYKYAGNDGVRDELRMLIDRCHRRNVMVIGHRVENAQSAASLWMSGIDFIQGNLVQQAASGLDFDFQSAVL